MQKKLDKKEKQIGDEEEEEQVVNAAPKVNIFAVDQYDSGIKTVVKVSEDTEMRDED